MSLLSKTKVRPYIFSPQFEQKREFYQTQLVHYCDIFLKKCGFDFIENTTDHTKKETKALIIEWIGRITLLSRLYQNKSKELSVIIDMSYENHSDHHNKKEINIITGFGLAFKIEEKYHALNIQFKDYDEKKRDIAFSEIEPIINAFLDK